MAAALCASAVLASSSPAVAQLVLPRPSQKGIVSQTIGLTDITVTYSRPLVKGRVIWGELVPYDKVWRTGANEATLFTITDDVTVDGKPLAAGSYSLHTIPTKGDWTVIFNKDPKAGGGDYKAESDALRLTVKPQAAEPTEALTFSFPVLTSSSTQLALNWEKLKVSVTIAADVNSKVMKSAKEAMTKAQTDTWQVPLRTANYFAQSQNPDEAMKWFDVSIQINANFSNLSAKARALAAQGKSAEAITTAQKAIAAGAAAEKKPDPEAVKDLEKAMAEWKVKKA
jgi:hypothetical protein